VWVIHVWLDAVDAAKTSSHMSTCTTRWASGPALTLGGLSEDGVRRVVEAHDLSSLNRVCSFQRWRGRAPLCPLQTMLNEKQHPLFFFRITWPALCLTRLRLPIKSKCLPTGSPPTKISSLGKADGLHRYGACRNRSKAYPVCVATDPLALHRLFIWSRQGDPLVPEPHMLAMLASRRARINARCVLDWSLDDSPHVMHLHTDRAGYQRAIHNFVQLAHSGCV